MNPGYKNTSLEELLTLFFQPDEIDLLITLSNTEDDLDSEITARINDLLFSYNHLEKSVKRLRPKFAERAIKHYILSSKQQQDATEAALRIIKAATIAVSIKLSPDQALFQNLKNTINI